MPWHDSPVTHRDTSRPGRVLFCGASRPPQPEEPHDQAAHPVRRRLHGAGPCFDRFRPDARRPCAGTRALAGTHAHARAPRRARRAAPQAAQPGQPKPYKDVLKDAKAIPGFFTLHQKDEKVWIEILPDQFDKPFFFSYNIPRSIGRARALRQPDGRLGAGGVPQDRQPGPADRAEHGVLRAGRHAAGADSSRSPSRTACSPAPPSPPPRTRTRRRWSWRPTRCSSPTSRATSRGSRPRSACRSPSTPRTRASPR